MDIETFRFGMTMALIGRHPDCGCPMALSMDADGQAQKEFENQGLLLEFLPASTARSIWEDGQWPCPHSAKRLNPPANSGNIKS